MKLSNLFQGGTVNLCKTAIFKKTKIGFQDQLSLNAGQKYCGCSNGSILQYFRPSLSYHLSLRSLFSLFLSGRFTQVLLYKLIVGKYVTDKFKMIIKRYNSVRYNTGISTDIRLHRCLGYYAREPFDHI